MTKVFSDGWRELTATGAAEREQGELRGSGN